MVYVNNQITLLCSLNIQCWVSIHLNKTGRKGKVKLSNTVIPVVVTFIICNNFFKILLCPWNRGWSIRNEQVKSILIILSFVAATRIHFLPREAGLLSLINQVFRGAFVGFFPWAGWLERGGGTLSFAWKRQASSPLLHPQAGWALPLS